MTTPSFLNTDFAYKQDTGVTDVQTIMDDLGTMLTSTLATATTGVFTTTQRWSRTAGTAGSTTQAFQSPADARGRYMKVTVIRTSAVRMEFKVEDPTGVILDGEIDIAAGGSTVNILAGPAHVYIEANNSGTWEVARAFMTDPTPETLDACPVYVWASAHRVAAGTTLSNGNDCRYWSGRYTGGTGIGTGAVASVAGCPFALIIDSTSLGLRTHAGTDVVLPAGVSLGSSSSDFVNNYHCGKFYQAVWVDQANGAGSIIAVPIDAGVTGNFLVTNLITTGGFKLAVRKP